LKTLVSFLLLLVAFTPVVAQTGIIRGKVTTAVGNNAVPFANVYIQGTSSGASADENGVYEIKSLTPGTYHLEASFVGFKKQVQFDVMVTNARPTIVNFQLEEEAEQLEEVVISGSNIFVKSEEAPLSLRTIGATEVKRSPGGNRDISRVIRSFPGVASTPAFRNDIIIRGGSPSENTFYLDGIQIPVINHFQTQGSSGGPVGIINVDLLRDVNFYSGAFPANRGNTMSSVFDFQLKEGRDDRWNVNGIIGASDLGVTVEGPISEKSTLLLSVRRSYLKFLFSTLNLPFLPVYNDLQFKYKHKFNDKNHLTILGIGAIDDFELNMDAPDKTDTPEERDKAEYLLRVLPVTTQWNYTLGARYDHFKANGLTSFFLSTNTLNNASIKYKDNDKSSTANLLQDYNSRELETRFRIEDYVTLSTWKISYGAGVEHARYKTFDYSKLVTLSGVVTQDFKTEVDLLKYNVFGQVSNTFFERLTLSLGIRADANSYSSAMNKPWEQFSPRFSASYALTPTINANVNTGIYYQLPAYTLLGYRTGTDQPLENKENGLRYIRSKHLVGGLEFNLERNARITVESFYKHYDQYPFLLNDNLSLGNVGADYGIIGNGPATSTSKGRSYGAEFLLQQKLFQGYYGLLAYTFVRSEFTDKDNVFKPSAWDNRHLVSLTGGKRFKRNWEMGVRWLLSGGSPYTPYNVQETMRINNWNVRPYGIPNYELLNSKRISAYHQLDIRIDKKFYFNKWSLNVYVDIQNIYAHKTKLQDNIDVVRDANNQPVVDAGAPDFYVPKFIENTNGTRLPTIGVIIEL
jgi:hypothetical protein